MLVLKGNKWMFQKISQEINSSILDMEPQNDAKGTYEAPPLGLVGGIFLDPGAALIVRIT